MTSEQPQAPSLADLTDSTTDDAEWQAWLAAHPREAAEVAAARQARLLLQQLRALSVDVPDGIETRILSKVHRNAALRELVNLNLSGSTRALLELLTLLFSLLPTASPEERQATRSA